jgi:microcystin degradation protein MlrC
MILEVRTVKVFVARFKCESNTFSDYRAEVDDFECQEGTESVDRIAACRVFLSEDIEVIPSISANCVPCIVKEQTYRYFEGKILAILKQHPMIDGVYLDLHGSMYVENIGSGELALVKAIRNVVGNEPPIALALDFHASMPEELLTEVNAIYSYRTAPHVDQALTEVRAAKALLRCIREKILPRPVMVRIPILACEELVTTREPLFSFMQSLALLDYEDDVISAALLGGLPWIDEQYATPCTIVACKSGSEAALYDAKMLAQQLWDNRQAIRKVDTFPVDQAVQVASKDSHELMFVLDSGDIPYAGARGDGTVMLKNFLEAGIEGVLIAGVYNPEATRRLFQKEIGERFEEVLGEGSSEDHLIPTEIKGTVKGKGQTLGREDKKTGIGVILDCGGVDLVLMDTRVGFTSPEHFQALGIDPFNYKVIVVKLGYLWMELQKITSKHIIASTPGQSTTDYLSLAYKKRTINDYPYIEDLQWQA